MYTTHIQKGGLEKKVDALVVLLFEEDLKNSAMTSAYNDATGGAFAMHISTKDFEGKEKQMIVLHSVGTQLFTRLLVIGMGKRAEFTSTVCYHALLSVFKAGQKKKAEQYAVAMSSAIEKKIGAYEAGFLCAKALSLATYRFQEFFTGDDSHHKLPQSLTIIGVTDVSRVRKGVEDGVIVSDAINFTRGLGNQPSNIMTPQKMAEETVALLKNLPVKVTVLHRDEMEKLGMGCMRAVSQGSIHEPTFIIAEYYGGAKKKAPVVWCGKGITFDSGGISIKPSAAMEEMKFDMLGAAAVAGGIFAIASLKLPVNVVGIMACAENLPSGTAMRPGDIIKAMNGKTIEVVNTDAEGRLVLADALSYATKFKPRFVIDMATLTGACVVALGSHFSGLFSDNKKLTSVLNDAGEKTGDRVWELPVTKEYSEHIKSTVADMKNVGLRGEAGASSAAAFLKEFATAPWAHIDIAGAAWRNADSATMHCGASGFGVHLMVETMKIIK